MKRRKTKNSTSAPKRTAWPAGKPLPAFESEAEEVKFWQTHDVDPGPASTWEAVEFVPGGGRHPRTHVYTVRLDDHEAATLQALAKRRGIPASVVIREFVRAQMPTR